MVTLVKVCENSKQLWKLSPTARVFTAFLAFPNFYPCYHTGGSVFYFLSIDNRFYQSFFIFTCIETFTLKCYILVPAGRDPSGQHQGSRPLAAPTPEVRDSRTHCQTWQFLLAENAKEVLCSCSKHRLRSVVSILCAGQKDCGLWGRKCKLKQMKPKLKS